MEWFIQWGGWVVAGIIGWVTAYLMWRLNQKSGDQLADALELLQTKGEPWQR